MNFKIDLAVLDAQEMRLSLTLHNRTDAALSDWLLTMDFARYIFPESLSKGAVKQVGTFSRLTPPAAEIIAANSSYTVEFKIKSAPFSNYECGIREAFICDASDNYQKTTVVSINPVSLKLPVQKTVNKITAKAAAGAVIPQPASQVSLLGVFELSADTQINSQYEPAMAASDWLSAEITQASGFTLGRSVGGTVSLVLDEQMPVCAYSLSVNPNSVLIKANSQQGFVHACATLIQLISGAERLDNVILLPCLKINDQPRYQYRGLMLDCARHFHSIATVKRLIKQLALYKYNYFHWHLTDDEGWRIEINAFPELTEIGAWRGPGTELEPQFSHLTEKYGGYYTKQEIREVISYAEQFAITVIPEIDIPGHSRAAIKSLPYLLADQQDKSDYLSIQAYTDNVLSPALPGTYQFIDKVIDEVCALFPSPYIHIGADEVPEGVWSRSEKCRLLMAEHGYTETKELQGHLLRYVENRLHKRGRRMLGWEEVKQGDKVSKETVVYSWIGEQAGLECIQNGFDVVMQPSRYTYFDLVQDYAPQELGVDWAGTLPLEQAYSYQPLKLLDQDDPLRSRILGVQCALWSEVVLNQDRIDHMLFPRLLANAEVCWSQPKNRNWQNFQSRLQGHRRLLTAQGINFREF
ncbi:beta-N-acetylhexosaminidase [Psychromonas ossibalaenae]|uniref:beta-N-acetylhexosaminidase n=1 Tax=Psychromonas ossibalaenae TaxID=444922 RepID=UPI00037A9697|nr:beta-N-acetylhexosaminidase [Psychromonas ossibalaenae]